MVYWKSTLSILPSKPSISHQGVYGESSIPVFALSSVRRINSSGIAVGSIWLNIIEIYETIINIIILQNDILPILGLDLGYTVKYSPPHPELPPGFALGNSLRRRAILDHISLVSS